MQFIENSFADKVRKGKIKSPLRQDFSIEKWNDAEKETEFDNKLHQAGLYFHEQFSILRQHLGEIKNLPIQLSRQDYLEIFIGMANRNTKTVFNIVQEKLNSNSPTINLDFHCLRLDNNFFNNELSINEVAISIVDGIYYNVLSYLETQEDKIPDPRYTSSEIYSALHEENFISQIYNTYEQYWNSILFEQIEFNLKNNNIFFNDNPKVIQPHLINDTRKTSIRTNNIIFNHESIMHLMKNSLYLKFENDKLIPIRFLDLDNNHQNHLIVRLNSFSDETINFIPNTLPNLNFNIDEVIQIFIHLSSIAFSIISNFDSDTSILEPEYLKYKKFNKIININQLSSSLSLVSGLDIDKINNILNFLTFTNKREAGPRADLWRSPLIKINDYEYIFLIEPILHSVGLRCFEGWMAKAKVDISQKGKPYEDHIKVNLNKILKNNNFINNFNILDLDTISINNMKEEIDLLLKIDNLIVLGEAKCIVTTDSAISVWHSFEIIKHASEQAIRKKTFIENNFEEICRRYNWHYDQSSKYQFIPIVINSSGFNAGYNYFNVPVIDHFILFSYFKDNITPLLSKSMNDHLAYLKLYSNLEELITNFPLFVSRPPSIESYKLWINDIEPIKLISCKDNYNPTIIHNRLGMKNITSKEILSHDYGFELIKSDDCDEYLESHN